MTELANELVTEFGCYLVSLVGQVNYCNYFVPSLLNELGNFLAISFVSSFLNWSVIQLVS